MFQKYFKVSKNKLNLILYKKYFSIFLFTIFFILFIFNNTVNAALFDSTPEIVNTLNSAFEKIQEWLLKLATPAAAVAICVGIFMQKFSFGDEERIRIAKKMMRGTLFCYGFILVLNLILSAIQSLLT